MNDSFDKSMQAQGKSAGAEDSPKFGRLLIVLVIAVLLVAAITFGSEAFYS